MKEKNKKLFILVSVLLLLGGVSFAFFISRVLQDGTGSNTNVTTANIKGATLKVEGTLEFNDPDILPGHQNVSSVKVTATGNNELIPYNLIWNGTNTLNTPLNYKVYKTSEQVSVTSSCEDKTKVVSGVQQLSEECTISNIEQLGSIISSGTISKSETESKTTLVKDEFVTATSDGETKYYYVVLEYPNLDEPQNLDIGGVFRGKVTVEESTTKADINILATYIKQEDGTYKETSDIPQEGYVLNSEESTCSNGATPGWNISNHRFYINNLTKSGTDCNLYFDEEITSKDVLDKLGLTATAGQTSFTGISTSNEGIKTGTDDDGTTYYYRGSVTNNWVKFADMYWRIIRINGDGSIRMIYTGNSSLKDVTVSGATAIGDGTQIQTSLYNTNYKDNAYVGYMYGSTGQSGKDAYKNTHANTNNSTIKGILDNWYKTSILDAGYDGKVDKNAGFCVDRKVDKSAHSSMQGDGYGTQQTGYAPWARVYSNDWKSTQTPSFRCSQANDFFTATTATKGNKALQYPVGLITSDEVVFAGGFGGTDNSSYYLYTSRYYWTMSPHSYDNKVRVFLVRSSGYLDNNPLDYTYGVRPVINLKADTEFKAGGNGTFDAPYEVI